MSQASLSPGVGRLVLPGARGTCMVILFLEDENCDPAQAAAFVCLHLQRTSSSWGHLFQSSDTPSGKPVAKWVFGCLWPVTQRRVLGEQREHSRCLDGECPQHRCFLTHCVTLLETLPHFSATGCYDTNFLMCIVASSEQRPRERGPLRHSSFPSCPQLWWRQPASPCYFLASVPSQQGDPLSEH